MHIRQAAAGQSGLERIEPVRRGVKGIEPPGAAHGRAQGQRFTPGASTKIHHHLAALGVHQLREQLRALVLHLEQALHEGIEFAQRRLAGNAQAPGRERCGQGLDARLGQGFLHLGALGLEGIHPQI